MAYKLGFNKSLVLKKDAIPSMRATKREHEENDEAIMQEERRMKTRKLEGYRMIAETERKMAANFTVTSSSLAEASSVEDTIDVPLGEADNPVEISCDAGTQETAATQIQRIVKGKDMDLDFTTHMEYEVKKEEMEDHPTTHNPVTTSQQQQQLQLPFIIVEPMYTSVDNNQVWNNTCKTEHVKTEIEDNYGSCTSLNVNTDVQDNNVWTNQTIKTEIAGTGDTEKCTPSTSSVLQEKGKYKVESTIESCSYDLGSQGMVDKCVIVKAETGEVCDVIELGNTSNVPQEKEEESKLPVSRENVFCDLCGNSYADKYTLIRHLKTHTADRIKCNYCDYSSVNKGTLMRHVLQTHTNIQSFKCDRCNYSSTDKIRVQEHSRRAHAIKRFKCDQCNYSFVDTGQLNMHVKTTHVRVFQV